MLAVLTLASAGLAAALRSAPGARTASAPPEEYETWTAAKKVAWLKANLDIGTGGTAATVDFQADIQHPPPHLRFCLSQECIYPGGTNTHKDVVEPYECRLPTLHQTGIVAWVKAKWLPNKYTGMFQKADLGIARWGFQMESEHNHEMMRYADDYREGRYNPEPVPGDKSECATKDCYNVTKPPRYSEFDLEDGERPNKGNFMALKFFRDGVVSASVHTGTFTMGSWNHIGRFYSNLLWNYNATVNDTSDINSMSNQGAQRGTAWPGFTGLHDMAMYDDKGQLQHDIKFPYQIIFMPTAATQGIIPDSVHGSYPATLKLAEGHFGPGTVLYEIYAKDSFEAPIFKIGELQLDSKLMLSADFDRQGFFYHPRYDRDIILRPELAQGYACKSWWLCPLCPIVQAACSPDSTFLLIWSLSNNGAKSKDGMEDSHAALDDYFPGKVNRTKYLVPRCGRSRQEEEASHEEARGQAGDATAASRLHGAGGLRVRRANDASAPRAILDAEMRDDDWTLDSRSHLLHPKHGTWCAATNTWPNTLRASTCAREPVPGRPFAEPEWKVVDGCSTLPTCDKPEGMWYSSTYPCICGGSSTCNSGQLCLASAGTCTSWGPWASTAGQMA